MKAFIFINNWQALRFGHVAWGFSLDENTYCWGSSDHLLKRPMSDLVALAQYSYVPPGGDIDFWSEQGSFEEMLSSMSRGHHIRYHAYKQIKVDVAFPAQALAQMELVSKGGWSLLSNNCIDHTYRVLTAFGADLLDPSKRYHLGSLTGGMKTTFPKKWFAAATGEHCMFNVAAPIAKVISKTKSNSDSRSKVKSNSKSNSNSTSEPNLTVSRGGN